MLNQVIMVGKVVSDPVVEVDGNGLKETRIRLAVQRNFKNAEGQYETDYINVSLWSGIAETAVNYCKQGSTIGIKARISTSVDKGQKEQVKVIAEKLTFINKSTND